MAVAILYDEVIVSHDQTIHPEGLTGQPDGLTTYIKSVKPVYQDLKEALTCSKIYLSDY